MRDAAFLDSKRGWNLLYRPLVFAGTDSIDQSSKNNFINTSRVLKIPIGSKRNLFAVDYVPNTGNLYRHLLVSQKNRSYVAIPSLNFRVGMRIPISRYTDDFGLKLLLHGPKTQRNQRLNELDPTSFLSILIHYLPVSLLPLFPVASFALFQYILHDVCFSFSQKKTLKRR